ncbi:glycosyl hydrolase family 28-related protein [Streptomyces avicenniae]|uniref:glycosyl hydrolase family 28-related protein n=1 Tax=Streptomyces avicenniae TaxID=500153 RepID=UPI000DA60E7F|nr:glycosyl hydrolase family 28-related protein [Streptomyces avicenniae]
MALAATGALIVLPAQEGHADAAPAVPAAGPSEADVIAAAGATTPFVTVEAETGTLGGGARVRSLVPGAPRPTAATLETEASGYALAELRATGDSVTIPNSSGANANSLVVRASIPDAPAGGGITATLNVYVNGTFRQAITLSSRQAWNYRGATTNPDDPNAGGMPYRFYNEFPVRITGAAIAPGSTITLRKDAANTAAFYALDSVDLENVGPARTQPADSLSVVSYGADPTFGTDSTVAIQNTVNAARQQGKSVWIPPGTYLTNSLAPVPLDFTGVTVRGAGMWHTTLYRKVPLPTVSWRSQILVGSGTMLSDLQIDANAIWREVRGTGGSDYGINASGADGWLVERIWTRHTDANWLSGTGGTIRDSRTADSYGDGYNINNSNTPHPDKRGNDITVQNNFARGTGDDSFAVYSDAGAAGDNPGLSGARVLNNTAIAPWWANGLRIAGGTDIEMRNNLVNSVSSNSTLDIGIFGDSGRPLESALVTGNVLIGGGGWNGVRHGARIGSPPATSQFPDAYTNVTLTNNVFRGSLGAGLSVERERVNATLTNNTIDGPALHGIWVQPGVTGTGNFSGTTVTNLRAGQVAVRNDSPSTFRIPAQPPVASTAGFRAHADGQIVTAANAGAAPLIADRASIGAWERFDVVTLPGGMIGLRAQVNGLYVSAENAGAAPLIANRATAGPWETFQLIRNADGSVSLRAQANGRYVSAANAGTAPLIANRDAIGPWERFDMITV